MPVVSEMVHPKGFDFATQRQIVLLREVRKLKWEDIAKQVKNLQGENPLPRLCANYYHEFSRRLGRRRARYDRCGNKPSKVTPQVEQFLVKQLKALRRTCVCTSTTLQQVLARDMGVKLTDRYVRKLLQKKGYRWLPRRQKRVYSTIQKAERLKFAKHVVSLSKAQLREKLSLAMDGVVLGIPPADPTDRMNFCRYGDEYMWRKRSEAFQPELAGQDSYGSCIPRMKRSLIRGKKIMCSARVRTGHAACLVLTCGSQDGLWLVLGNKFFQSAHMLSNECLQQARFLILMKAYIGPPCCSLPVEACQQSLHGS